MDRAAFRRVRSVPSFWGRTVYSRHVALLAAFGLLQASSVPAQDSPLRVPSAAERLVLPDHASALKAYRPYRDAERSGWREVNDEVGRVGGHIGILKAESDEGAAAPSGQQDGAPPMPRTPSHQGGHGHGRHR
jgi:hypothetical protein